MMNVIFAGAPIGLLVIPIMVFHQLQLMVCSFLARKWAKDVGKGNNFKRAFVCPPSQCPVRRRTPSYCMSRPGIMMWLPQEGIFAVTGVWRNWVKNRWKDSMSSGMIVTSV